MEMAGCRSSITYTA